MFSPKGRTLVWRKYSKVGIYIYNIKPSNQRVRKGVYPPKYQKQRFAGGCIALWKFIPSGHTQREWLPVYEGGCVAGIKSNSVHNLRSFVGGRYPTNAGDGNGIEIIPPHTYTCRTLCSCLFTHIYISIVKRVDYTFCRFTLFKILYLEKNYTKFEEKKLDYICSFLPS